MLDYYHNGNPNQNTNIKRHVVLAVSMMSLCVEEGLAFGLYFRMNQAKIFKKRRHLEWWLLGGWNVSFFQN